jgi:hypothetical protein
MICKGICIRHKAHKPYCSGRYAIGCEIFIKWNGLWCPCCSCRLRLGPRLFKQKAKLREQKQVSDAKEVKVLLFYLKSLNKRALIA